MQAFDGRKDLLQMIRKYLQGTASPEEAAFVEAYDATHDRGDDILDQFSGDDKAALESEMEERIMARIAGRRNDRYRLGTRPWLRWAAAASIVLVLGAAWLYVRSRSQPAAKQVAMVPKDFAPGGERAVLTLADGSEVNLDHASEGHIASQGAAEVTKRKDGQLEYKVSDGTRQPARLNRVSTPAGGQYSIVLADGSKVWLNAKSSISFPTAFDGTERKVTIEGECFFEITKDKTRPFVIDVDGRQRIVVTGTQFNVNAYRNEPAISTTLVEGGVSLTMNGAKAGEGVRLRPGQQAASDRGGRWQVREVDVQEVVAWKNGLFQFRDAPLESIMRQIERWYNVDVAYEGGIPDRRFSGKLRRNSNASQILEILRFAGVNFRIEGSTSAEVSGKIIVLPNDKHLQ